MSGVLDIYAFCPEDPLCKRPQACSMHWGQLPSHTAATTLCWRSKWVATIPNLLQDTMDKHSGH